MYSPYLMRQQGQRPLHLQLVPPQNQTTSPSLALMTLHHHQWQQQGHKQAVQFDKGRQYKVRYVSRCLVPTGRM